MGFGQGLPGEANDGHDGWGGHPRGLGPSGVDEEAVDGEGVALTVGHGELVPGLGHPVGGAGGEPPTALPLGILIPGDVGEVGPKVLLELGGGEEVGVEVAVGVLGLGAGLGVAGDVGGEAEEQAAVGGGSLDLKVVRTRMGTKMRRQGSVHERR